MTWPLASGCSRVLGALAQRLRAATGDSSPLEIEHILGVDSDRFERFVTSVDLRDLTCGADELRSAAEAAAWNGAMLPSHLPWLCRNDFSREDVRRIRYLAESFYAAEPVLALLASLAIRGSEHCSTVQLAEPVSAFRSVHLLHRALAAWPRYAAKIADDLAGSRLIGEYETAVISARERATQLAVDIMAEPPVLDVQQTLAVSECLDRSCEALVHACALRRMFVRAELKARRAY